MNDPTLEEESAAHVKLCIESVISIQIERSEILDNALQRKEEKDKQRREESRIRKFGDPYVVRADSVSTRGLLPTFTA